MRKLAGAGAAKAKAQGPTVLDPATGATSAEAAARMEDAAAQDDDLLAAGEEGETDAQKQERLARRLGVSWYKISNGDVLDQAISKLHTAIPNFVSFKVREKDVNKKTRKNQAVFERDSKHKKHGRGGSARRGNPAGTPAMPDERGRAPAHRRVAAPRRAARSDAVRPAPQRPAPGWRR